MPESDRICVHFSFDSWLSYLDLSGEAKEQEIPKCIFRTSAIE